MRFQRSGLPVEGPVRHRRSRNEQGSSGALGQPVSDEPCPAVGSEQTTSLPAPSAYPACNRYHRARRAQEVQDRTPDREPLHPDSLTTTSEHDWGKDSEEVADHEWLCRRGLSGKAIRRQQRPYSPVKESLDHVSATAHWQTLRPSSNQLQRCEETGEATRNFTTAHQKAQQDQYHHRSSSALLREQCMLPTGLAPTPRSRIPAMLGHETLQAVGPSGWWPNSIWHHPSRFRQPTRAQGDQCSIFARLSS